jgi:hypothetical protein
MMQGKQATISSDTSVDCTRYARAVPNGKSGQSDLVVGDTAPPTLEKDVLPPNELPAQQPGTKAFGLPRMPFGNSSSIPSSNVQGAAGGDAMQAYQDAMKGSSTQIVVCRWNFERKAVCVFCFFFFDNGKDYWAHKPEVWEMASEGELKNRIFEADNTSLDEMMNGARAAPVRQTPNGLNIISTTALKNGKTIDRYVLVGFAPSESSDDDVMGLVKKFIGHCQDSRVRAAYKYALEARMRAESIKKDVTDKGPYWTKLACAANNMSIKTMNHLSETFMDNTIETIMTGMYEVGGQSHSMWPPELRAIAYGNSTTARQD